MPVAIVDGSIVVVSGVGCSLSRDGVCSVAMERLFLMVTMWIVYVVDWCVVWCDYDVIA